MRKLRDRSEMIRDSTNINWVCENRVRGRIDAVYDKHSIVDVGYAKCTYVFFVQLWTLQWLYARTKIKKIWHFYSGFETL